MKCPSYEQEIFQRDISLASKLVRKQLPKYINENAINVNPLGGYTDSIRKSVDKFQLEDNNLLIISDNRFLSLVGDPFLEENLTNALRQEDPEGKISSVLLINVRSPAFENVVNYTWRMITITKTPQFHK